MRWSANRSTFLKHIFIGQDCASLAAVDAALSPVLRPLLSSLLGSDYVQAYGGVVEALPGAGNQAWHLDGEPLFADIELPPHAVTVFVALGAVDADSGLGSPQVRMSGLELTSG